MGTNVTVMLIIMEISANMVSHDAIQSQKAVSTYLTSKQILFCGCAKQKVKSCVMLWG